MFTLAIQAITFAAIWAVSLAALLIRAEAQR